MYSRLAFALILAVLFPALAQSHPDNVLDGYAGDPPNNQTCVVCHSDFSLNSGPGTIGITNIPSHYQSGDVYTISLFAIHPGASRWGFQATILDAENNQAGTLFPMNDRTRVSDNPGPSPDYISQSLAGTISEQMFGWWNFYWIAPPTGTGDVTLYATTLSGDAGGDEFGDYVYSTTMILNEDIVTPPGDGEFFTFWNYHDFGNTPVGNTRSWQTIGVNTGGDTLRNLDFQMRHGTSFNILSPSLISIPPSEVITIEIAFEPLFSSYFSDSLLIRSPDRPDTVYIIGLYGFGTSPLRPTPFHLLSPEDGAIVREESLTFFWGASFNPDSTSSTVNYQLQVDRESDFSNPMIYETGFDSVFTIATDGLENDAFYFWRVLAHDTNTEGRYSEEFFAFITDIDPSGVEEIDTGLPENYWTLETTPNPFNNHQKISFVLNSDMNLEITVVDVLGRHVVTLTNDYYKKGQHDIGWNGGLTSGIYFIIMQNADGKSLHRKVVYLK